jgi:3-methylcrotonyl-CoA carboxylase alpha subunit
VRGGDAISIHYDPMIAKLIVCDRDRTGAVGRLRQALAEYEVAGVTTNLAFLAQVAGDPAYAAGEIHTGFIPSHAARLFPRAQPASRVVLAAAVWRGLTDQRYRAKEQAAASADPWSPWNQLTSWRMNTDGWQDLSFHQGDRKITVRVHPERDGSLHAEFPGGQAELSGTEDDVWVDGVKARVTTVRRADRITVIVDGINHDLDWIDPLAPKGGEEESGGTLTAPMPGRIIQVLTQPGAHVTRGAGLLVLEAMKMEYTITAPADGTVKEVRYATGEVVDEGTELIVFASEDA